MKPSRPILYFAPGSGLGHLNRALAVCLALRDKGCETEIVTNSPFAEGVARLARTPITRISTENWKRAAPAYLEERRPRLVVIDTFPAGMRSEWASRRLSVPVVYLARRLKWSCYQNAVPEAAEWSALALIIAAEELCPDHASALSACGAPIVRLAGPVRLIAGAIATPVPAALERQLDSGRLRLVIHAGPEEEMRRLCDLARAGMTQGDQIAAITPWQPAATGCPVYEYFPGGNLVGRAAQVISGAGYNMMADMMSLRDRHTAIAFERRFDDQAGRLPFAVGHRADGTDEAAVAIMELL